MIHSKHDIARNFQGPKFHESSFSRIPLLISSFTSEIRGLEKIGTTASVIHSSVKEENKIAKPNVPTRAHFYIRLH